MSPMKRSDLPLRRISQGKVRDVYAVDADRLLLVATDRVARAVTATCILGSKKRSVLRPAALA